MLIGHIHEDICSWHMDLLDKFRLMPVFYLRDEKATIKILNTFLYINKPSNLVVFAS